MGGGYWLDSNSALRLIDGSGNWMERASWLGSSSSSPSPRSASSLMWQGFPGTETVVDADKKQPKEQDGCRLDRAPGWGRWIYFVTGTNLVRRWPGKFFLVNMSFDNCLLDVSVQVLLLQLCFNQMSSTQVWKARHSRHALWTPFELLSNFSEKVFTILFKKFTH